MGLLPVPSLFIEDTDRGAASGTALFALAIEPLAEAIRSNPNIGGFKIGPDAHKISLYADDNILFWIRSEDSLYHILIKVIKLFFRI